MKIYVSNIPYSIDEKTISLLFGIYGTVRDVKIIKDKKTGKSRGFCFIEMPNINDARNAIKNLNNYIIEGRKLFVNQAHQKKRHKKNNDTSLDRLKAQSALAMKDHILIAISRVSPTPRDAYDLAIKHGWSPEKAKSCKNLNKIKKYYGIKLFYKAVNDFRNSNNYLSVEECYCSCHECKDCFNGCEDDCECDCHSCDCCDNYSLCFCSCHECEACQYECHSTCDCSCHFCCDDCNDESDEYYDIDDEDENEEEYEYDDSTEFEKLERVVSNIENTEGEISCQYLDEEDEIGFVDDNGTVYISKGIIKSCRNDDELAFIISHEIAHRDKKHIEKHNQELKSFNNDVIGDIDDCVDNIKGGKVKKFFAGAGLTALAVAGLVVKSSSTKRIMEDEADIEAQKIMDNAGYNPKAAEEFILRKGHASQGFWHDIVSTHPTGIERANNLRRKRKQ